MNDGSVSTDLYQFFGAHFHQDWDLEADDWQGIVDGYVAGTKPTAEKLRLLAEEIDNLHYGRSEAELDRFVAYTIGVDYDPQPMSYTDWLHQIANRLRQHAARINDVGAH